MSSKNDRALSSLAGIAILLVVIGHADPLANSSNSAEIVYEILKGWIYTFHMPLFFFMAGYSYLRFTAKRHETFQQFVSSKGKRLLLPFVVLTCAAYLLKFGLSRLAIHPHALNMSELASQLVVPWTNVVVYYWFLPTLFLALLICRVTVAKGQNPKLFLACGGVSLLLFFGFHNQNLRGWQAVLNLGGVAHNFVYVWLGAAVARFKLSSLITKYGVLMIPVSLLSFSLMSGRTDQSSLALALALIGVLGLWAITHRFQIPLFDIMGSYSYSIYLLSWFFQTLARVVVHDTLHLSPWAFLFSSVLFPVIGTLAVAQMFKLINLPQVQQICGFSPVQLRAKGNGAAQPSAA